MLIVMGEKRKKAALTSIFSVVGVRKEILANCEPSNPTI